MRYYITSILLHICLILALKIFASKKPEMQNAGQRIAVNMTALNSHKNSGKKQDLSLEKKNIPETKKKKGEKNPQTPKPAIDVKPEQKPEKKPDKKTSPIPKAKESMSSKKIPAEADGNPEQEELAAAGDPKGNSDEDKPQDKTAQTSDKNSEIGEGFVKLADGSLAAKHQGIAGLSYGFISKPEPDYPTLAKKLGYKGEMVVKVRFLINEKGNVEEVKLYTPRDKYGFSNEVEKCVRCWKLTPIMAGGKPVKMYIFKSFRFRIED
ncbi:TonB family protein [uncultured Ilyobacter sp.]|uniref:energy transducer TonB n=1 Tax=uncultured Ilyobacter sp. TaxID=544433 RepID=UPI0029C872EA|nr:TonB family protein [uncultured Ilyobacter sp.]